MSAYYVSLSGSDTAGSGSVNNPWRTLQKALDTVPLAGGTEIVLGAGTYQENGGGPGSLRLNRAFAQTVVVRPADGAQVIITCGCPGVGYVLGLLSGAANVTFQGLTIRALDEFYAIFGVKDQINVRGIAFRQCTIESGAANGAAAYFYQMDAANVLFEDCTISASGANSSGVALTGLAGQTPFWIDGFIFRRCTVTGARHGLRLLNSGYVRNLSIEGGEYRGGAGGAAIGQYEASASGAIENVTLTGVITRGMGRGINIGGATGTTLRNIRLINCNVDATEGVQTGVLLGGAIDGVHIEGGQYHGGEAGGGYGAIFISGPGCTSVNVLNASIASKAPDPVSNRVLALGIQGARGVVVRNNHFAGDGRAIALQDEVHEALIENNMSDAEDFGFRVGHDGGEAYDNSSILVRGNRFTALYTAAVVIGKGAHGVTVEDNILTGGESILRVRSAATDDHILVRSNILDFNPLFASAKTAAVQFYGARGVDFTRNTLASSAPAVFAFHTEDARACENILIALNRIQQSGGVVYQWNLGSRGANVSILENTYHLQGAAFGEPNGVTLVSLSQGAGWAKIVPIEA